MSNDMWRRGLSLVDQSWVQAALEGMPSMTYPQSYNCPKCGTPNTMEEGFSLNEIKCWKCQTVFTVTNTPRPGSVTHTFRDPLLVERQKTHGDFGLNASVSQSLKRVFNDYKYRSLKVEHSEALDMIALKLSRILSGQSSFKDHWDDIAGYAKLASEACPGNPNTNENRFMHGQNSTGR